MLVLDSLTADIQRVFAQHLESAEQVAEQIGRAYQKYAAQAQGNLGEPVVLFGFEYLKIKQAMISLVQSQLPAPLAANAIGQAVVSFWLAPPILTAGGGICATIIPAAGIGQMIGTRVDSVSRAAAALAGALDAITRTAIVAYPSPLPPGPLK